MIKKNGYSLLEMLFALAIAAIAAGVSVPFLIQYRENSDFENSAEKIIVQTRQTKNLAVTTGDAHIICAPLGEQNSENGWNFFTIKNTGKTCEESGLKVLIENTIDYPVFQKSGETEISKISFFPRGTAKNKSFCIENKKGNKWKKITVSNFARITATSHNENPCVD